MSASDALSEQFGNQPEPGAEELHFSRPGLNVGTYGTEHPSDVAHRHYKILQGMGHQARGPGAEEIMGVGRALQSVGAGAQMGTMAEEEE